MNKKDKEKLEKKMTATKKAAAKKKAAKKAPAKKAAAKKAPAKKKAAAKKAPATRQLREEQNGVKKPLKDDSLCGQVWVIAEKLLKKLKRVPTVHEMIEEGNSQKPALNVGNVKTEYALWRKFYGHAAVWNKAA